MYAWLSCKSIYMIKKYRSADEKCDIRDADECGDLLFKKVD